MDHYFLEELKEGSIQIHDDLQFELKLEFNYNSEIKHNTFIQEFYLFIPESLQINPQTYSKKNFYLDQTNFIRYKTPYFTFNEILNPVFIKSPLNYIPLMEVKTDKQLELIIDEIKLFGNIFRSTLRDDTITLVNKLNDRDKKHDANLKSTILQYCENISKTHSLFLDLCKKLEKKHGNKILNENLKFVDEFITNVIDYYLIGFLQELRSAKIPELRHCDQKICDILLFEKKHRKEDLLPQSEEEPAQKMQEMIAYRQSLLQKFMVEALQLKSNRIATREQHGPLFGSIAAGAAMLSYMLLFLFIWKSPTLMINSIPFVLSVVVFYILKDRIKEGVKSYYKRKADVWFPDYKTKIQTPENVLLGELSENFSFIDKSELPDEIYQARNMGFHNHLETLHRHETIIYYKRDVNLFAQKKEPARNELNMIFRYNIHRYLEKASDPIQYRATIEEDNLDLTLQELPKVYHVNIVMKETNTISDKKLEFIIKKYRVILDKRGIRLVENL